MEYYAYQWLREDGTPYYVGKGCNNRAFVRHVAPSGRSFSAPSVDKIQIIPAINEDEALELEIRLIKLFGRAIDGSGCLHNIALGGTPGNRDPQTRAKMSATKRGHEVSAETRSKISAALKGKPAHKWTDEQRIKFSEIRKTWNPGYGNKGKVRSPELKARLSAIVKARAATPEGKATHAVISAKLKGKPWSEARRRAQRAEVVPTVQK